MNKALFGYDPNAVERMLQERDTMLKVAERRVQAAETKSADLESRLQALELAARAESAGTQPNRAEPPAGARGHSSEAGAEDLAKVVTAAEASASQIIQAWTATRDQIVEADRLWRDVQDEVVRFAAWRDDVEPLMTQVQQCIEDARARIEEVPARVQMALAPAVDAMVSVTERMTRFASVSTIPLLPVPIRKASARPAAAVKTPAEPAEAETPFPAYEISPTSLDVPSEASEPASDSDPAPTEEPAPSAAPSRPPMPRSPWGEEPVAESGQLDRLAEAAMWHGPDDNGQSDLFDG